MRTVSQGYLRRTQLKCSLDSESSRKSSPDTPIFVYVSEQLTDRRTDRPNVASQCNNDNDERVPAGFALRRKWKAIEDGERE
ncbi:hypothetical protein RB195_012168 [Necator americanus]|uniref:Uncharacterized protein n=1 Tax=Necator americanus TaxID=51031 RepID=A0ABR1D5V1_NECAM